MFDITQLNQSSFRGVPFYTRDEEHSGGQRLTDHTFINGGTLTESNGIRNGSFKIKGYIGGDNYLTQKLALKEAFETIGSGILIDKFYGSLEVEVDTWVIQESITKFGRADIDVTFKLSENKPTEETLIVYNVDVRDEAIANFKNDFNNEIGDDLRNQVANDITKMWEKVGSTIKFLEDERGKAQAIKSSIGKAITQVKSSILSVDSLAGDIIDVWGSFDEILDTSLFGADNQKSFTNTLRKITEDSADTTATTNEAEKTANEQTKIYTDTVIAGLTQTAINNLENVEFETGDDLGSVKDDILTIFVFLEKDIKFTLNNPIEETVYNQNLLNKYQLGKRTFIQFYTQKYSGLQDLKNKEITVTTNVLDLTMNKYNDIDRSIEVLVNNDIVDPLFINGNLKLLDR